MKFSTSLSSLFVLLPILGAVSAASVPSSAAAGLVARQNGRGRNRGGNNNNNNNAQQNNGAANAGNGAAANNGAANANNGAAANNGTANANNGAAANNGANANNGAANANNGAGNANAGNANNGAANNGDPQTSLTLDPAVIAPGFANDGQDVPTAGQVASLTSTNNFINFCLTVPNLPITNGQQIRTGSCNPAPIGVIPSVDNMPSSKFVFPKNGDTVPSNEAFTIQMAIQKLETGNFVNAQQNYFAAPQQLNGQGQIVGHSHVVVELLDSLAQTTPTDPRVFAFFKGLNGAAQNGQLTADVTAGLAPGAYRLCSINTSANHAPAIVPIAQHGSLDDCIYFTASPGGAAADNAANAGNNAGAAAGAGAGAAAGAGANAGNNAGNGANAGNNAGAAAGAGANAGNNANAGNGANAGNNAGNGANAGNNAGAGAAAGANAGAGAAAGAGANAGAGAAAGAGANAGAGAAAGAGANAGAGAAAGAGAGANNGQGRGRGGRGRGRGRNGRSFRFAREE